MTRDPGDVTRREIARGVQRGLRALALFAALAALAALAGCGSDDDGGSAGSAPMVTPTLGEPCTTECTSGLVCSPGGLFPRQCSAQCSGVGSCNMLALGKNTNCFGGNTGECGLRCTGDGECPAGTKCRMVGAAMGCLVAP